MNNTIKIYALLFLAGIAGISGCKKTEYQFGELKTPSNLALATVVAGVDANNPDGNGTGSVIITSNASNAITYNIDFGDGTKQIIPTGTINYKYTTPGTHEYTITANAIGTGGNTSTISKKVKVYVAFEIPASIVQFLTGGSSKTWMTANEEPGHVGVGPADQFSPIWYAATPNQRAACLYDDEITFTKDANNNITMSIDNKGQSFSIGAATSYYGTGGGDDCYAIDVSTPRKLAFMGATSASTSANSTRIQFVVPGNGLINFGTGGNTYEILSISETLVQLRNIGIDGNAWYQILKAK